MFDWVVRILARSEYSAKEIRKAIRTGKTKGKKAETVIQEFIDSRMKWALDSVREYERRFLFCAIPEETFNEIRNWIKAELMNRIKR